MLAEALGQLADRGRLAGAVDADDEHDRRPLGDGQRPRLAEQLLQLFRERRAEVAVGPRASSRRTSSAVAGTPTSAMISDSSRPLPGLVVRRVEGGERYLGGERLAALRERVAQAREEATPGLLRLGRAIRVAQQLAPRPRHRGGNPR